MTHKKLLTIGKNENKEIHNLNPVLLLMVQMFGRVNTYPRSKTPIYWSAFGRRFYSKFASM